MFQDELRHRVKRIASGVFRPDDVDRLFLGLRDKAAGRDSVREIGDFIAHREQREKGLITRQAKDVILSFQSWIHIGSGGAFDIPHVRRVTEANLRASTDKQLTDNLGLSRQAAKSALQQALRRLEGKTPIRLIKRDQKVIDYLGGAFIWVVCSKSCK